MGMSLLIALTITVALFAILAVVDGFFRTSQSGDGTIVKKFIEPARIEPIDIFNAKTGTLKRLSAIRMQTRHVTIKIGWWRATTTVSQQFFDAHKEGDVVRIDYERGAITHRLFLGPLW